jgi:CPA1 family monovalent cation:H+ antiporter
MIGSRVGVAAPLLLVTGGMIVGLLPWVPPIEIEPEWILAGVLPPLLYSTAVSMPAMSFRRDFGAIGALSVVLVVLSAVLLGLFFNWVIPELGLAWGIALGAIVSPTDAVATSIVRRLGVSPRVVTILEGEGLLNDATALTLLRTAIAGAAASVSLWGVASEFVLVVLIAVVVGFVVGHVAIRVRARITETTVNTALSFTVPFLAAIPAEHLGGSGLVAAVVAGVVTGHHAPRDLSPRHRLSDRQNWRTVEFLLEGAIFLVMGLQLYGIVEDVRDEHAALGQAILVAALALLLTVLIRAAYLAPLLVALRLRARRGARVRDWIHRERESIEARLAAGQSSRDHRFDPTHWLPDRSQAIRTRIRRGLADIEYLLATPLGWREGTVLVWAGMRGAVTLAAAQTLPTDTPQRPVLILIAFLVATASLLLQGGSLAWVIGWVRPARPDPSADAEERERLLTLLRATAERVQVSQSTPPVDGDQPTDDAPDAVPNPSLDAGRLRGQTWLAIIAAQRRVVLDARDEGTFSADLLEGALRSLDADEIAIRLRGNRDT